MKKHLVYIILFSIALGCQPNKGTQTTLQDKDVNRIVLLGGSLISEMDNYGFFEKSMIRAYSDQSISFRNIGWPADDVFGLARSQFGSAQNTKSWQPPSAEEGFGSQVLMQHINEANPSTLIIGYGSEVAFSETQDDFELFKSGYIRLLDFAEKKGIKVILLSPTKQEVVFSSLETCSKRNSWLAKANTFIKEQSSQRGYLFIDLFNNLIEDQKQHLFTTNGIQLNKEGYKKMSNLMLKSLNLASPNKFTINLDEKANIIKVENCKTTDFATTVRGVSFDLTPDQMLYAGNLISKEPVAVYINGQLHSKRQDTISFINLLADSLKYERISATIKEKNSLHRYRIRPLNEAYIFLFRRHEMGHLAYEINDLNNLVVEKEREISKLMGSGTYNIEIELIKPWTSPKDYPEDEVPTVIPEPNIAEEIAAFKIAEGYEISLFASDPMIANPISINWDTRGRAWVATSSTYPHIVPGREPNDRIVILEDTNKDGKADKHTIFADKLLIPHSVMPVSGGAYVTATTQLLFLPDTDGDDIADQRRIVYDGFGNADVHHMIHGLRWSPWGDLHFTQSIYINSFVDTPYGTRVLNGSGTWSFRPEIEKLEIMTRGLINPWGFAFDQWGQSFATDGAGSSGINYVFPGSAHATAVGVSNILPGLNSNTPKNTAAEVIYSRHFPKNWQGNVITNDFRANRTVRYSITPEQSGYLSKEVETIIKSDHRSYRPVDCKIGPDGALYIVDWYNPIIDHGEVDFHHPIRDKTHGRIWKVTKKGSPLLPIQNFTNKSSEGLLELLKSPEQYTRLQANRAYVEEIGDPKMVIDWIQNLKKSDQNYTHHRLEGLWLLTALNHYDEQTLLTSLKSNNPKEKAASIRMLAHWKKQDLHFNLLDDLIEDPSPQVRLEALHALRDMGDIRAAEIAIKALNKPLDKNLEFALNLTISSLQNLWLTGMINGENIFESDQNKQLYALTTSSDKRVVSLIISLLDNPEIDPILANKAWLLLANIGDSKALSKVLEKAVNDENLELLTTMYNAPDANEERPDNVDIIEVLLTHKNQELRLAGLKLSERWKVITYSDIISEIMKSSTDMNEKIAAGRALVSIGQLDQISQIAQKTVEPTLRTAASVVWIEKAPEAAAENAIKLLEEIESSDLAKLIWITFRRSENGTEILKKTLKGKKIPESTAIIGLEVIQRSGLNLTELENIIRQAGNIETSDANLTFEDKKQLIKETLENSNPSEGESIYLRKDLLCASCHKINGSGGLLGPDLTSVGAYMTPNSILESILNPNSDIKQGYETVLLTKTNGEIVSGLLHRKTANSTLVRQPTGEILEIPESEISNLDVSPSSLMPSGLTNNLSREELRDLLAFLISLGVDK